MSQRPTSATNRILKRREEIPEAGPEPGAEAASGKDTESFEGQVAPTDKAPTANPPPAGTLPTRKQLNAEVDRMFREFLPDAPKKLDPKDPKQADLVDTWLGIRDGILDQWTDKVFFSFFPNAPKKLDPSKSDDAQLIKFWSDIRHQIRDGPPGRYQWESKARTSRPQHPRTPSPTATPAPAPPLRIVDVHHYGNARVALDFNTDATVEAAAAQVFPKGTPKGVTLSVYGPHRILLEHVSAESLKSMPDWLAKAFMQATQGIENDPQSETLKQDPAGAGHGKPHPEIDIDTPEELESWLEKTAHIAHVVGDYAELAEYLTKIGENIYYNRLVAQVGVDAADRATWAGANLSKVVRFHRFTRFAEVFGWLTKALSIVGDIGLIIWVGYQLITAFMDEKQDEVGFGYLYGVMWEALDEPDHIRVYKNDGMTYSAKELREAFVEGVGQGRNGGKDPKLRKAINTWIMVEMVQSGIDVWAAETTLITEQYNTHQRSKGRYPLGWPTPIPYSGIVGMIGGDQ
jgi:hypothetical protein